MSLRRDQTFGRESREIMNCEVCLSVPAAVRCKCSNTSLCAGCLSRHVISESDHPHQVESLDTPPTCCECRQRPADQLCCCEYSLRKLCAECGRLHTCATSLPLGALQGDCHEFYNRQRFLLSLLTELRKACSDLDRKEQEIDRFYSQVMDRAEEYRQRDKSHYKNMRVAVEHHLASLLQRVEELRRNPYGPHRPGHVVDELLVDKDTLRTEDVANALKLYNVEVDTTDILKKLEMAVEISYENSGLNSQSLYFFLPGSNIASIYDVEKGQKRFIRGAFPLVFKQDASWCLLPNGSIFYCGGFDGGYSREAMILYLSFKSGKMIAPMLSSRKWAGVACVDGLVYVFGGCGGPWLKKCERFSLQEKSWTALSDMNEARAVSGPAYWKRKFLLCGYNSPHIEIFDIASGNFFTVPQVLGSAHDVLCFVHGEFVVFLQKEKMMQLNMEANVDMEVHNIGNLSQTYTRISPLKYDRLYYYVDDRGRVWSIDVEAELANVEDILTL